MTVYNIGFQVDGEWLGQRSWSDFYNVRYELPDDYFDENGEESWIYRGQDFLDYTPRVFKPIHLPYSCGRIHLCDGRHLQ